MCSHDKTHVYIFTLFSKFVMLLENKVQCRGATWTVRQQQKMVEASDSVDLTGCYHSLFFI
jgi:hypothetical protein